MTRSRSFFYLWTALRFALPAFLLLASAGCSHRTQNEAADKLCMQAADAVRQHRLTDAEKLYADALPLYAQADNPDRFNETTAALAGVETQLGKFTSAFAHFHAARFYFEQKNDAAHLVSLSNALADLYARTGRRDSAAAYAASAMKFSTGSAAARASSYFELGRIDLISGDAAAAVSQFERAAHEASSAGAPRLSFDIAVHHAAALAALDMADDAQQQLQIAARHAAAVNDASASITLNTAAGAVYLRLGMDEEAMHEFLDGMRANQSAHTPGMDVQLLCGIGEVFLANNALAKAREYFTKAHDLAGADGNAATAGYCLVRLGECDEHEALHTPAAPAILHAVSLFQQASALSRNDAAPQRFAIALLKEASLRAALHEDADAETLFKRAFELMRASAVQRLSSTDPYIVTDAAKLLPSGSADDWWYRPYASFLLRERRIGDALAVMADGRAATLRRLFDRYPIAFQNQEKNSAVASYLRHERELSIGESAAMARQALRSALVNDAEDDSLRARCIALRRTVLDEASALSSTYPTLFPLAAPALAASAGSIARRIPDDASLVAYLALNGRMYAVVASAHSDAAAVELGAETPLRARIADYCAVVQQNNVRAAQGAATDDAALRRASMQLAAQLFAPIAGRCARRILVYASEELGALPLHALVLSSGRAVGETYDISYTTFLNTPGRHREDMQLKSAVVFGAPSSGALESEYELRSIKNFYPDATVIVTLQATEKNFREAAGDLLHLSTFYERDPLTGGALFALSGGSITTPESYRPASAFLLARPFSMWIVADQRRDSALVLPNQAMFALMSGASLCILQRYTCAPATAKEFNENFYTSLAAHGAGRRAYTEALAHMREAHPSAAAFSTAPYFLFEW